MLLAHKVQLYPTAAQAEYLRRCMGAQRFTYNALLAHFKERGNKWSKQAAYNYFIDHVRQPWMSELTSRAPRNAIDDLHNAFQHFFRRCKAGGKPGFPRFHKKGVHDSFALREKPKFDVRGRLLRIEKAPGRIRMQQALRWAGVTCAVTISQRAGKFFAAVLVETQDYTASSGTGTVGVDFGVKALATLSTGEMLPANQKLKANLRRLQRRARNLSHKQRGSRRRAKAKLALARLQQRIADQRSAVLHEASDMLTRRFGVIVIEDLAVKNMVRNHCLARAISDAGFGALRRMIEYKAALRGAAVIVAPRFYPSSKTCSACGVINETMTLAERDKRNRRFYCEDCGHEQDCDVNAALNLLRLDTLRPDVNCAQEPCQSVASVAAAVLTARTDLTESIRF
jgi:putative transposase